MTFIPIDEKISVSPQIDADDVRTAAAQGYTLIINNRPDHEGFDQPLSADLEKIAQACGIAYKAIPISGANISTDQIDAMVMALGMTQGKILAFCRTGNRSTLMWALARRKFGDSVADLTAKAQAAGFSLAPIQERL